MRIRRNRVLQLGNWRLKYKLGVVLAVPLLAAVVLGALRITTQLEEANRYDALAHQIAVAPALLEYSTALVSMATVTSLGIAPSLATSDDVTSTMQNVIEIADANDLEPAIAEELDALLADGAILNQTVMNPGVSTAERGRLTIDFLVRCKDIFRDIFDLLEDNEALVDANNLLTVWDAQLNLQDELETLKLFATDAEVGQMIAGNAINREASTLGLLLGSRLDTGQIEGMLADVESRRSLIQNYSPTAAFGEQLRGAMVSASQPYADAIVYAGQQITSTLDRLTADAQSAAIRDSILVGAMLVLALVIALLVARSLGVPLRRLRNDTLTASETDLPAAIAAVKDGADVNHVQLAPIGVDTDEEIGEVARAVDSMKGQSLRLAGEQAHLRQQVNVMFETLARRNKTLVEQQLSLIDSLEYQEKDPARLQSLFSLDHLATRMRRTGESLLVLAGTRPRTRNAPAPLTDVLRGAVSQVENYQRVHIGRTPHGYLLGNAIEDVVHLIAELVDNALRASPPNSPVRLEFSNAEGGGLLLEIADVGIGIPRDALDQINTRLSDGDEADVNAPRQMGLFVVGRLAARNGMSVRLRPTFDSDTNAGVTAAIYFPSHLLAEIQAPTTTAITERPRRLSREDDQVQYTQGGR
ncbi:MAG TPA: ATP-binding protein [Rhodococcus sp. (in: high G+C Gram-positive bacteria)]|nr:ATP-binding protein [Rhodococcus sp. (in: high G+C Gram-positive bacteria)]